MVIDKFTNNKQKVRQMDYLLIKRHFHSQKGKLRYLGLPSSAMFDIVQWQEYFSHFSVVERGKERKEFIEQHNLILTAMQQDLADQIYLLRGDMDEILIQGKDDYNNQLSYPYDVVSLDYSGGLVYKNEQGRSKRTDSISRMIEEQGEKDKNFLLLLSCNMDFNDQGEIRRVLIDIKRELGRMGIDANLTIQAFLNHNLDEARLKVYVPYIIMRLSYKQYQVEFNKPIYYKGNKATRMMHFAFVMKRTDKYIAGKPSSSAVIQIINNPVFNCVDGKLQEDDFGISKLST